MSLFERIITRRERVRYVLLKAHLPRLRIAGVLRRGHQEALVELAFGSADRVLQISLDEVGFAKPLLFSMVGTFTADASVSSAIVFRSTYHQLGVLLY